MIVLWPHAHLWDLDRHVPWLKDIVIALSFTCAGVTVIAVLAVWFRPAGLRCVLSIGVALIATVVVSRGIAHMFQVDRPFVAYDFKPLFPHSSNPSFPSTITAYVAVVTAPMLLAWRKSGLVMIGVTAEVAVACVYVGVHYGSDVVGGAALGGGFGVAAWCVLGLAPFSSMTEWADHVLVRTHLRPKRMP